MVVLILGIGFTAVEPLMEHDYQTAFWTIFGPLFFGLVGWIMYEIGHRRALQIKKNNMSINIYKN